MPDHSSSAASGARARPAGRSFKLPPAALPLASAFYMSAIMALLMCTVIVSVSQGLRPGLLAKVMHTYALAMPTAFACVLVVRPFVGRLVQWTVRGA